MIGSIGGPEVGEANASNTLCLSIAADRRHRLVDLSQQGGYLRSIIDPMGRQRLRDHLAGGLVDPHISLRHVRRLLQPC